MRKYIKKNLRTILEGRLENQEMVDAILDKISSQGIQSLTPEEKRILQNPNEVPEPFNKDQFDKEIIDYAFGDDNREDDYEVSHEEMQEDMVQMALSQMQYEHGNQLIRKKVGAMDADNNKFHYIEFYDINKQHIMDLEERVYIKHGGGEEVVGILRVDNKIWNDLFREFNVDDENKIKVFQKYLGEMFGYDIEKVEPAILKRG